MSKKRAILRLLAKREVTNSEKYQNVLKASYAKPLKLAFKSLPLPVDVEQPHRLIDEYSEEQVDKLVEKVAIVFVALRDNGILNDEDVADARNYLIENY